MVNLRDIAGNMEEEGQQVWGAHVAQVVVCWAHCPVWYSVAGVTLFRVVLLKEVFTWS